MDASTNLDLDTRSQDRHPQLGQCADRFHFPSLAELHEMPISPMCGTGLFRMAGPLNKCPYAEQDHTYAIFLLHATKDLAYEIVHCNTITLQFNRIMLERAERDLHAVDELVGCVHLTIRESGHSPMSEYAMQEPLARCHSRPGMSALDIVLD
ncbi:hypothetical protein SCLCIDRAFT_19644 [Scleroderma citrinum Foug A]|uniref:Uncharacterized protein n=1 Tax=Scleroderma citrinum Foug A TaxID=1036808 RepID=A0A0C3A5K0_9AGAM|nr:hypothetical protein SCLCIDRAFT_19644 [Scleroderma citrinum Foug A]